MTAVQSGPRILDGVVLYDKDLKRLSRVMTNWLRVHAHMSKQKRSWEGYEELRKMLAYELMMQRRLQIVVRVFGHAMELKRELLRRELLEHV